jgi:hypothetical protein
VDEDACPPLVQRLEGAFERRVAQVLAAVVRQQQEAVGVQLVRRSVDLTERNVRVRIAEGDVGEHPETVRVGGHN